ncbi:Ribosomal protein S30 [Daphnia magna]|uniref:Ribosomal protein S30 n=1 Tax=Daphnia magna TaxID=35525 RepID=A0A164R027_9CRUS|nr:Ribosomal protein S30 [Daphnia magna]
MNVKVLLGNGASFPYCACLLQPFPFPPLLKTHCLLTDKVKISRMQLTIRGQNTHLLECTGSESIAELKSKIAVLENLPVSELRLFSVGAPLADEINISTLTSATVDVTVPLLGGKVHGSLARAGKVKHQTPKVDKQEKKKKKTGRAKRRVQYNRRFVNVVPTFGRKKGPNANAA